jgi:hypothetical protein
VSTEVRVVVNKASFDRFQFALNEFRMATGITMRDSFIREAGFCCYEFMRYSPPMPKSGGQGLTSTAKKCGEEAVNVDIQALFRPKDDPGAAFQKMGEAVSKGDLGGFLRWQGVAKGSIRKTKHGWYMQTEGRDPRGIFLAILLGNNPQRDFQAFKNRFGASFAAKEAPKETTDIAGIHKQFKDRYNGRIHKNKGPALNGMKYLVDAAKLKAYIELRKKAVGFLKAGWANTLLALPKPTDYGPDVQYASTAKVPAWIMRNKGSRGYANFSGNLKDGNFNLTIGNNVGDNDGVATRATTINHVLNVRANKLDKEVMRRLGKYIRAFNAQN